MDSRLEFVALASREGANLRELARRFGVSPTTAYKYLHRYLEFGPAGLLDRSRRPHRSPAQTPPASEAAVLHMRATHPAWGGRKIRARLLAERRPAPQPSTITAILRRHGRIEATAAPKHRPWQRFEQDAPNRLWQMDFKGHFSLERGRCHPLTVLDDYSRFALALEACGDERTITVQTRLTNVFRRYGLPDRILTDNGAPWGSDSAHRYTPLTVWLLRLGVGVSHSRPYHPQTQGKDERFHRTLQAELLRGRRFADLASCQRDFDRWRALYNLERPHQALELATPASRYAASSRTFPEQLPAIEYGPDDLVRKVQQGGELFLHGRTYRVSHAFYGYPLALRPTTDPAILQVFFCQHQVATLDLRDPPQP